MVSSAAAPRTSPIESTRPATSARPTTAHRRRKLTPSTTARPTRAAATKLIPCAMASNNPGVVPTPPGSPVGSPLLGSPLASPVGPTLPSPPPVPQRQLSSIRLAQLTAAFSGGLSLLSPGRRENDHHLVRIATPMIDQITLNQLEAMFDAMDTTGDGRLTREDFVSAPLYALGASPPP